MKTIRCLIVDDEPLAREIIQTYLSRMPGWEVAGACISAEEAYEALLRSEIDVLFLDIQMPVISGTEFLRSLKNPPLVVFTTAYSHYAVEGFALNAVDYLLKPITLDRFFQAVEKLAEKLASRQNLLPEKKGPATLYIFIKYNGRLVKVDFDDMLYIKAEKDFSFVYGKESRLLASMHLKIFEALLPEAVFTRVHRSYIINLSKVTSIFGNTVFLGSTEIPIGSNFKEDLYRKLNIS